jgi:catechol 2,3-dioxygenase-like lactoylglutathione lyase family enzyme
MESAKANITDTTDLIVTTTLIVADIARSLAFYRDVFEATVLREVHASEIRCYIRDPDGYLVEVGQTTSTAKPFDAFQ